MNNFKIILKNIQHIITLSHDFNLSKNKLHCIVGKNGTGKTTLIKSILNFQENTTLDKLSRNNIITNNSSIEYEINNTEQILEPILDNDKYVLDSSVIQLDSYKNNLSLELPIPFGKRFKTFNDFTQAITEEIRTKFSTKNYNDEPKELIEILNYVYENNKTFDNLKQIIIRDISYYIIPQDEQHYLREDDFSSGEYMIVQLYKLIKNKTKMIVIDEMDISLDSSAQVRFIEKLKELCTQYEINIIFTTHSLAIMKKIDEIDEDLLYMDYNDGNVTLENRSYNFIKAELFQFTGYDKIILVEDKLAQEFIKYNLTQQIKCSYEIIFIGGHAEVTSIMNRNKNKNFLGTKKILTVLDGDQKNKTDLPIYDNIPDIIFLPILSVEKELHRYFQENKLPFTNNNINYPKTIKHKAFYKRVIDKNDMTNSKIFDLINNHKQVEVQEFTNNIVNFLNN
jgi:ABC-type cobalamin/Fe3+-siderophores transport system ATPase subunit